MDTEGLDIGEDHELRMITAVACLLSSNLIFNTRELSNADLKHTAVMGEVARLTRGGITSDFPHIILLSRDISPEWLTATLAQGHTMDSLVRQWLDAADASRETREYARTVRECFTQVRMATVPPPERVDNSKLPELVPGTPFSASLLDVVKNQIIPWLVAKTVGGAVSNGKFLADNFLPNAIALLNKHDPLSIPSLTEAYAASMRSTLVANAARAYHARWNGFNANTQVQVHQNHANALGDAKRDMVTTARNYFPNNEQEIIKAGNELDAACNGEYLRQQNVVAHKLAAQAESERIALEAQRRREAEERARAVEQLRLQQAELARLQEQNRRLQGYHLEGTWRSTGRHGTHTYTVNVTNGQLQAIVQGGHPRAPPGTQMFLVRLASPTNGSGQSRRPRRGNTGPCTLAVQTDNQFTVTSHGRRGTRVKVYTRA
jgi:hypothetical protein